MTPERIVERYIQEHRPYVEAGRLGFVAYSLPEAIRQAASKNHGTHQYRLPRTALPEASRRLLNSMSRLKSSSNFPDLLEHVREVIEPIHGIGELAIYDVALRIGYNRGLAPERVYLHAGAAEGARALGIRGRSVHPRALPSAFRRLTPAEIENCLCIYQPELRGEPPRASTRACSEPRAARARVC